MAVSSCIYLVDLYLMITKEIVMNLTRTTFDYCPREVGELFPVSVHRVTCCRSEGNITIVFKRIV